MTDFPQAPVTANHVEAVPRRVRAFAGGTTVVDTVRALYVWEWAFYPQYYVPRQDVAAGVLVDQDRSRHTAQGVVRMHGLRVGKEVRDDAARVVTETDLDRIAGAVRFDWQALDSWFEEDEEVFVHPRNPYTRVDALRSARAVRVELAGVVLAESPAPVMVFETGLPTRYYLNRTEVDFTHLTPTPTVTSCPYKGRTSAYWTATCGETVATDVAWSYDFPTRQLLPIAGLVAFYNEKVDLTVDGRRLPRPVTHFS